MLNQTRLPWMAALAAFLLYVCTMGGGMTTTNLSLVSQLAGWSDLPIVGQPLLWFLTLPLRWLPAAWVAPALKLIAAALAAGILGLLIRTVQLLPWDRSWDHASRLVSWLPALTAIVLCGLELSFWREATSTCADLLDLLLLAAAVWLLLEYNVRRQVRWLEAAFLVWGAGMAENWVMLFCFPVFVAAVIWLERMSFLHGNFFQGRFLLRLALLLLAGFSLYLVLPMVNGLAPHSPWTLGQSWLASLSQTKSAAVLVYKVFWRAHRVLVLAVAVCYLVASLPLLVRMRDEDTHSKSSADRFQLRIYRVLRLGLLLACFWLAFDPAPGARQMIHAQLGGHMALLSFDYLNALGAAFLLGNLLLIAYAVDPQSYRSRRKQYWQFAGPVATGVVALLAVGLLVRNAPAICRANFHSLDQFGATAAAALPPGPGILLGENSEELVVLESALARQGHAKGWTVVNTRALATKAYRARLEARHPAGWLANTNLELTAVETVRLLEQVARTNQLYYLHPACNLFFERFYLEPAGLLYAMKLRGKDPLDLPLMPAAATEATEQYWNRLWDRELSALAPPVTRPSRLAQKLAHYGLIPAARDQDRVLAEWYSLPLENWAVLLQRQGRLREAHERFEQVVRLNTNNVSARLSLACNTNLQSGVAMGLAEVSRLASELGNPGRMELIVQGSGPFDNPAFNYLLGCMLLDRGMLLQSAELLERVRTLVPTSPAPEMNLAEIYNRLQMPERSRPLIAHLRSVESATSESSKNSINLNTFDLNLALLDSHAWLLQTNLEHAREALQNVIREHPDDPQIFNRVLGAYVSINDVTNALLLVESRLAKTPDDIPVLSAKASILVQAGRAAAALPIVDRIVTLTNTPAAHLGRAFARMAAGEYAAAKEDLSELEKNGDALGPVNYGLAVVAKEGADTNTAILYLQRCLTNIPVGQPLWRQANNLLQQISPPKP